MQVWRLTRLKHAANALDGEGAARVGGRWNSPGRRLVYSSATLSLALLEVLVHMDPDFLDDVYAAVQVHIPDEEIRTVEDLMPGWESAEPAFLSKLGDGWISRQDSLAISVPSAIVRRERNFLINPAHPRFDAIVASPPEPFALDPRFRRAPG